MRHIILWYHLVLGCTLIVLPAQGLAVSAPQGFTAVRNGDDVWLTWLDTENAQGYNLYYGFAPATYVGSIDLGNRLSRMFKNLPLGRYYVALTAYDGDDESPFSAEITIELTSSLERPANFSAIPIGNEVNLQWSPVKGANSYVLHYGLSSGVYIGAIQLGNTTGKVFPSVPSGRYYVAVSASSGEDESPLSEELILQLPMPAPGSLSIASLSASSIAPFEILSVSGTGISPLNSAVSVLFTSTSNGSTVAVPVIFASENNVEVAVPPLMDPVSGQFISDIVNVAVVQTTGSSQVVSNTLTGLQVQSVPALASALGVGEYSLAFIAAGIDSLENARDLALLATDEARFLEAIDQGIAELENLQQAITDVTTRGTAVLPTLDGSSLELTITDIEGLDQLFHAYVSALTDSLATGTGGTLMALKDSVGATDMLRKVRKSRCRSMIEDVPEFENLLAQPCQANEDLAETADRIRRDMPKYAKVAYGGILVVSTGAVTKGIGTLVGAGRAGRVFLSVAASWVTDWAIGKSPTPTDSAKTAVKSYADDVLGAPVLASIQPFVDLLDIIDDYPNPRAASGVEPKAGIMLNSPSDDGTPSVGHRMLIVKDDNGVLSVADAIVDVVSDPVGGTGSSSDETTSLEITNISCTVGERFSFGTIAFNVLKMSGTASGPVGSFLSGADQCSAWSGCERLQGQSSGTGWEMETTTGVWSPQSACVTLFGGDGFNFHQCAEANCPTE